MKCGHCGARMTQVTGKSGRYRYYKCTTRMSIGVHRCTARNLSRESTEHAVLTTLADKVFTPSRVEIMIRALRTRQRAARSAEDARFQQLPRELKEIDTGIARLYEAVEKGLLPLDKTLLERSQKLQARRQDVLVTSAALRDKGRFPSIASRRSKVHTCAEDAVARHDLRIRQGVSEPIGGRDTPRW